MTNNLFKPNNCVKYIIITDPEIIETKGNKL